MAVFITYLVQGFADSVADYPLSFSPSALRTGVSHLF